MFAGSRLLIPVLINFVTLVPETREEGGTRCQRALAAEGDRGAEEIGQQEVAETASGCPKRWCWSKRRAGGTEDSLPCSWVEEGWLPSERERRSRPVRLEAEACCHPPCLGRSRERGTRCRLPSTGGATAVRQEAEEHRAVHQRCPVPSHGTASEPLSWLRTERQCVREPDRDFFFSSLSSLSLLILPSPFLSPRLSLPPGTPRPPWRAPPGREGRGGVERSLVGTPRPARGDGGMWRVGRGREPWERSEASGVIGNERHLHRSPVSSPSEGLNEEWQQWKTREDQAWNFSLCFVCGSRPWGAAAFLLCLFIVWLNVLNVRRFPPPSSRTYQLRYNI